MKSKEDLTLKAALYDATHRGHEGDLAFYQSQCPENSDLLELGCGSGRILSALSPRKGRTVGLDIDASLLSIARELLPDDVEFFLGNMLSFRSEDRFDRILLPFNGIYCLGGMKYLDNLFQTVSHHLREDGIFLVDLYDVAELEADAMTISESVVEDEEDYILDIQIDREIFQVFESTRWYPKQRRFEVTFRYESMSPLRLPIEMVVEHTYFPVGRLLDSARKKGFEVLEHYEGFPESEDEDECPHVLLFRKAKLQL